MTHSSREIAVRSRLPEPLTPRRRAGRRRSPRRPRMQQPVRALQHTQYRTARADPGRRFRALLDKAFRRDVLARAWLEMHRNNAAAGIDRATLAGAGKRGIPGCSIRLLN